MAFACSARHAWPERFADQVAAALAADTSCPRRTWFGPSIYLSFAGQVIVSPPGYC